MGCESEDSQIFHLSQRLKRAMIFHLYRRLKRAMIFHLSLGDPAQKAGWRRRRYLTKRLSNMKK